MPAIVFDRVTVSHGEIHALNDVTLAFEERELVTVVGPSGSGKSTLLRVIAGLETLSSGRLLIDGSDVGGVGSAKRDVAMVFQEHALYPHKTAEGNLLFPLEVRHVDEPERSTRVERMARMLGLHRLLERQPRTLSVGQRNAVATGRALVRDPAILLLDEPLANLDAKTRLRTRLEVRLRHEQSRATTLYATNDQAEAMALGDRTVVLNRGMVQQFDRPPVVYGRPANLFVARFVGSPPMNALSGVLEPEYPDYTWTSGNHQLTIPTRVVEQHPGLHGFMGRRVVLGIRPQHLRPTVAEPFTSTLHGTCRQIEDHGDERFAHLDVGEATVVVQVVDGGPVPGVGNRTEITVDLGHLHFFDPETGTAIPPTP